jgi:hypothetical protein
MTVAFAKKKHISEYKNGVIHGDQWLIAFAYILNSRWSLVASFDSSTGGVRHVGKQLPRMEWVLPWCKFTNPELLL